jgi:hypothetical protein
MILQCSDLERALRTPELMPDMRAHAETCVQCAEEIHLWEEISRVAPGLRQEWESPFLWQRIQANLAAEPGPKRRVPVWRWALAFSAACAVIVMAALMIHPGSGRAPAARDLLTEHALSDVQQAEAAYAKSIGKLAELATKDIEKSPSPLAAAYREKLALLDSAIADARAIVEQNRYNTFLRAELASLYQEKQKTLEEWLRHANANANANRN